MSDTITKLATIALKQDIINEAVNVGKALLKEIVSIERSVSDYEARKQKCQDILDKLNGVVDDPEGYSLRTLIEEVNRIDFNRSILRDVVR